MPFLKLKQSIHDAARLKEIVEIMVKRGFHAYVDAAKLSHSAKPSKASLPLQERAPAEVRETLEALGPTFVKLGQLLSLRPDLIPLKYCEEFRSLQDDVAPLSFGIIKRVVEAELGHPLLKIFKSFSHEPLASASIAQVHRAVLKSGKQVVVKVQRPGVKEMMLRDIHLMEYLATRLDKTKYGALGVRQIVKEFKSYTERELDFSFEKRNLQRFHTNFANDSEIIIPQLFENICTQRLLILERVVGVRVSDKALLKKRGHSLTSLSRIGVRAMVEQVFNFGLFHADPHPGNLIATRVKGNEALAFIDFGIVGSLDKTLQQHFLHFLRGLLKKDARVITFALLRLGEREEGCDLRALQREIGFLLNEWDGSLEKSRLSLLLIRIFRAAIHHHLQIPADIVLLGKALLTMEGTAVWLNPKMNLAEELQPLMGTLTRRGLSRKRVSEELFSLFQDYGDLARRVPFAADALINKLAEGRVEVKIDKSEFEGIEQYYDVEVSKQNLALIAGAFFIGSAVIAGFSPGLLFLNIPLYYWGFSLFILTFLLFLFVTVKVHHFLEAQR